MSLEGHQLGEFEILERLGGGGMGAVYKARQPAVGRFVAIKTLQESLAQNPNYIARFNQEVRAAGGLSHANLVQVITAGETDGLHWFAMEYVEGESAKARLERKGRLEPREAIEIVTCVARALEYGWRKAQLIHRDIKPDNIFLSNDNEVKLGDLGLAKTMDEAQGLTVTGHSMGTPHYISPEQVECMKDVDLRADIYSLGCTLFHFLAGEAPFAGSGAVSIMMKHVHGPVPDLREAWPECPEELGRVVGKMMQKAPSDRQQNYAEVIADLRRAGDEAGDGSGPGAADSRAHDVVAVESPKTPSSSSMSTMPTMPAPPKGRVSPTQPLSVPPSPAPVAPPPPPSRPTAPPTVARPNRRGTGIVLLLGIVAVAAGGVWLATRGSQHTEENAKVEKPGIPATPSGASATPGTSPAPKIVTPTAPEPIADAKPKSPLTPSAAYVNSLQMPFQPVAMTEGGKPTGKVVLFSVFETRVSDYQAYDPNHVQKGPPDEPVTNVSFREAVAFCQWLSSKEGKTYRLPKDHEWSCAVGLEETSGDTVQAKKMKNRGVFPWGQGEPPKRTALAKVGQLAANRFGLFDLGGNVMELCDDLYHEIDGNHLTEMKVARGSSWKTEKSLDPEFPLERMSSSWRIPILPDQASDEVGFRCVLER